MTYQDTVDSEPRLRLYVYIGPVCAAKTTSALSRARRIKRLGKPVVLVRPFKSMRGDETEGKLITKDGQSFPSVEIKNADDLLKLDYKHGTVFWVDEPALIPGKLFKVIQSMRKNHAFLVSGISQDSEGQPFGTHIPKLLACADKIIQCIADCDFCGRLDSATRSLSLVSKNTQVLVGGQETYRPACPDCWNSLIQQKPEDRLPI